MSTWTVVIAVVLVLALAAQSVRATMSLARSERLKRLAVLAIAGALGALVVYQIAGGEYWSFGLALGLGVVEVGPVVLKACKHVITSRAKGLASTSCKDKKD